MSLDVVESAFSRFPKAPIWRRGIASTIDFVVVWLLSSVLAANQAGSQAVQIFVFIIAWLGLRVFLVARNQGQSLGHWALDMKVIDAKLNKVPGLSELTKREGIMGLAALLMMIALSNLLSRSALLLVSIIPLIADCAFAFTDPTRRQTFHDRLAQTIVISARRGYSLDLKVKRLFSQVRRRVQ